MASIKRALTTLSVFSTSPPSDAIPMRRQDAPKRYLTSAKLQAFLAKRFPEHPNLEFHIQMHDSVFSFDAPEELTEAELETAENLDLSKCISKDKENPPRP